MKIPIPAITEVISVGADRIQVRASQIAVIPLTIVNGKTRLLKPVIATSSPFEVSFNLHASHLPPVLELIQSLHRLRADKDGLQSFVTTTLSKSVTPFDLTALSSHREALLLPHAMKAVRVKKMLEINGLVQISKNCIYFQSFATFGFKKVKKFSLIGSPGAGAAVSTNLLKYKLKNSAVEFSFANGKNLLILFQSKNDRDTFLACLPPPSSDRSLPPLSAVTDMWRHSTIANFDYLMYLNFQAGRSVNDIGQYPIFPWVVANMTANTLDLTDPTMYRNLSIPIAAMNPARLAQYKERSLHMPLSERFLFGSFYSNPAFVLYFLIRKFPECHLRLHGGHFDHTARLFTALKAAWEAVADNGSATMELIPEFFSNWNSSDEWLANSPALTQIPDLSLPAWAASPSDFVLKMRCALESAETSRRLHEWIDLIFGVKSRGKQICFDSNNLFHPVCYLTDSEGDVQAYCRENDTTKEVVTLQSQEFGHVPKQLFVTERHPQRIIEKVKPERSTPEYYKSGNGTRDWRQEICDAYASANRDAVSANASKAKPDQASTVKQNSVPGSKSGAPIVLNRNADSAIGSFSLVDFIAGPSGTDIGVTTDGHVVSARNETKWKVSIGALTCVARLARPDTIVCGGEADGCIYKVSVVDGLILARRIHQSSVNCIACISDEICVSGSKDNTVAIWNPSTLQILSLLDGHCASVSAIGADSDHQHLLSGDASGVLMYWTTVGDSSSPIWSSSPSGCEIKTIKCLDRRAVVVDASGAMLVWDLTGSGSILWKHSPSIPAVAAFFPTPRDNSVVFTITANSDGTTVQSCKLSATNGQFQFTISSESTGLPPVKTVSSQQGAILTTSNELIVVNPK